MIVPSQPSVLPRRIAASAVDLFLVGFLWLLVLYRLAVRFEIAERDPGGSPIYSENQRAALSEIADGLNFGRIIGDFYYSIHGRGLVLSFLSLLIFSLIAWVLVPANTGWSVGHRAFGLAVTDMKGNKPPLDSYLRRYLVGVVDLFPFVIPGLLGWLVASRNEHNQRMGDLSADTIVVDATAQPLGDMPAVTTTLIRPGGEEDEEDVVTVPPAPDDPTAMVDVSEALAPHLQPSTTEADYPVLNLEETAAVVPATESIALSESIPASPSTGESPFVESLTDHEEAVADEAAAPLPDASFAENWHFPEAQDAPVWTPEPSTNNGPQSHSETAEEAPSAASSEAASAAGMGDPVWNEQWSAWLYWDAEGKKWLRHDADKGWIPIGNSQKA